MATCKLGYAILYVEDLDRALKFYGSTFGFAEKTRLESYAELDTGATTLAFAERGFIRGHLGLDVAPAGQDTAEIGVIVERAQVDAVFRRALDEGATALREPQDEPWNQRSSYVRDPDQHIVEICSPVG